MFFLIIIIFLKSRITYRLKEKERESSSIPWVIHQMAVTACAGPGWNEKPITPFRSCKEVAGAQIFGLSLTPLPYPLAVSEISSKAARATVHMGF